jgi:hypothetical protein
MDQHQGKRIEVINRNTVVSLALEQGFNAFLPVYDGGIDFILYREGDGALRKVQQKSRWTIGQKYVGRDIWIAFPFAGDWYLIPHDIMVASAEAATRTTSWTEGLEYSRPRLSTAQVRECAPYRFAPISKVAAEAEADAAAEEQA